MRIRLARATRDAEAVAAIYAPYVRATTISFELEPPGAEEMRARIEAVLRRWPWLVAETAQGALAGYAYAGPFKPRPAYDLSVEVSAYLAPEHCGQGLGRRLYDALLALLEAQGIHALFAGIALPNPASEALHRAIGMTPVGTFREAGLKFGAWQDVAWYQRTIGGEEVPAVAPRALPRLDPALVERILAAA